MKKKHLKYSRFVERESLWINISFRSALFLMAAITVFLFVELARISSLPNQLAQLPTPAIRTINLPEPLIISKLPSSVLGLGTFDPLDIVTSVNEERAKIGNPALRINQTLMRAAQLRADVILKHENFSHYDPYENIILGTVLPKVSYNFVYASENIGMGGNSGRDFVNGFMHSPSHRENLLDPKLTETGVAVVDGPFDRYYVNIVVQLFAIPAGREEYLGYSAADYSFYQTQLTAVTANTNPVTWFFLKLENSKTYSNARYKTLGRQREILETIIKVMVDEKPLENDHIAMIREYNKNLAKL